MIRDLPPLIINTYKHPVSQKTRFRRDFTYLWDHTIGL